VSDGPDVAPGFRGRPSPETLRWATRAAGPGSRAVSIRRLSVGISTAKHTLTVEDGRGREHRFVLRRYVDAERLATNPWEYSPATEAAVLRLLADSAVSAPPLIAADPEAEICDAPALLLTRLPGRAPGPPRDMDDFLRQLAEALPAVHAVAGSARTVATPHRRYEDPRTMVCPSWTGRRRAWERAIELMTTPEPDEPQGFIHRDYHPGNTVWSRGRMTGIVDWATASWGPASLDLSHMRWNLVRDFDAGVAERFLAAYHSVTGGVDYNRYWDLWTAVDGIADSEPLEPHEAARLDEWVATALADLG
jgi:aminoglycoside phosphotransferase (APT) family kinase protein